MPGKDAACRTRVNHGASARGQPIGPVRVTAAGETDRRPAPPMLQAASGIASADAGTR